MAVESKPGSYGCIIHKSDLRLERPVHRTHDEYCFRVIGSADDTRMLLTMDMAGTSVGQHLPRAALEALRDVLAEALAIPAQSDAA